MSVEAEAANEIITAILRVMAEGTELALKTSGDLTQHTAAMISAALSAPKTQGQVRLKSMLMSGRPVSIFSVNREDVRRFAKEAKRYGVTYCVIKGKEVCDIMVTADQSAQVKKVMENLEMGTVRPVDSIQLEQEPPAKTPDEKNQAFVDTVAGPAPEQVEQSHLDAIDQIVDDEPQRPNPTQALTQDPASKPLSQQKNTGSNKQEKLSVKKEIEHMKSARRAAGQKQPAQNKTQAPKPKAGAPKK